ncbi:hypothetical protein F2P81_015652 [Scophthalmus maximus]|uniref:Uncharacterized protein n=1 Tax=Scophthalmus maximus TaxID=52904 RepID=A0A6A4SD01_SCOMX|nr:hypothetical protein F2P81_015652 [Scophthalmus maximus]
MDFFDITAIAAFHMLPTVRSDACKVLVLSNNSTTVFKETTAVKQSGAPSSHSRDRWTLHIVSSNLPSPTMQLSRLDLASSNTSEYRRQDVRLRR